jgi:hypothetical protein
MNQKICIAKKKKNEKYICTKQTRAQCYQKERKKNENVL